MKLPRSILTAIMFTALCLPVTASAQCRKTYRYRDHGRFNPPAPPAVRARDKFDDEESYFPSPPSVELEEHLQHKQPIIDRNPPWHFEKSVTLSAFRGGSDLPYDGFRGCGPFAIASLLDAYDHALDPRIVKELAQLDPQKDGTPPEVMMGYLEGFFGVTEHATSTTARLVRHLDSGSPALLIVRSDGDFHWCLVTGYQIGHNSEIVSWTLVDNGQLNGQVPHDEFLDMWNGSPLYENYALFIYSKLHRPFLPQEFQKTVHLPTFTLPKNVNSNLNGVSLLASLFQAGGTEIDQHAIDHINRQVDPNQDGIATNECVAYLERFFDVVQQQQHTSPYKLTKQLDAGLPALVILNTDDELHWSLVTGYRNDNRRYLSWRVLDEHNTQGELSHAELLTAWHKNYSLFIARNEAKPGPTFPPAPDLTSVVQLPVQERLQVSPGSDSCGPLAVAAFLIALGKNIENTSLSGLVQLIDPEMDGTSAQELTAFLGKYFAVNEHYGIDSSQLQNELDAGRPVVLAIDTETGVHWSVLTGYRTDRNGKFVSWDFVQNGKVFAAVSHEEFLASAASQEPLLFVEARPKSDLKIALLSVALECILATLPDEENQSRDEAKNHTGNASNTGMPLLTACDEIPEQTPSRPDSEPRSEDAQAETTITLRILADKLSNIPWRYILMFVALAAIGLLAAQLTQPKVRAA